MPHCVQICTDAAFFAPKKSEKNKFCAQFLQKQRKSRKNGIFLNTVPLICTDYREKTRGPYGTANAVAGEAQKWHWTDCTNITCSVQSN